jgi:hypothetical protein
MEDRRANVAAAADGRATLDAPKHGAALLSGAAEWAAAQTKSPSMAWGLGSDDGRGSVSYFTDVRFSSFNGSRTSQCNDGLFVLNSGILRMGQGPRSTGKKNL